MSVYPVNTGFIQPLPPIPPPGAVSSALAAGIPATTSADTLTTQRLNWQPAVSQQRWVTPDMPVPGASHPFDPLPYPPPGNGPNADSFAYSEAYLRAPFNRYPLLLDQQGNIFPHGLQPMVPLGHMDAQGNYQLNGGIQGNIFIHDALKVNLPGAKGPFGQALKTTERIRAYGSSEIPLIRQQLTRAGWDGRGQKVAFIEGYGKTQDNDWRRDIHTEAVMATVNDAHWGVAPSAQTVEYGFVPPQTETFGLSSLKTDSLLSLNESVITELTDNLLNPLSQQIYRIVAENDPSMKVVNISYGLNRSKLYEGVMELINKTDEVGNFRYPEARRQMFAQVREEDRFQTVIDYIDRLIDSSPRFQQSMAQYHQVTQMAAQQGTVVVVTTGNEHNRFVTNPRLKPDTEFSFLCQSPYVISVAAVNTNGTPGNFQDDYPATFSSRGDGRYWFPTIAAPGDEVWIGRDFPGGFGENGVLAGTSFAAPYVSGVIALMRQKNPMLTFDQIRHTLQQAAVLPARTTPTELGAGVLNPLQALALTPTLPAQPV
ncbi:MAG: S8 family serine peptidase [Candidatus Melainabacteria bacterium]